MILLLLLLLLEVRVEGEVVVRRVLLVVEARHHARLLVLADALLEEVGLALQRDVVHEVEGVLHVPPLGAAELLNMIIKLNLNN